MTSLPPVETLLGNLSFYTVLGILREKRKSLPTQLLGMLEYYSCPTTEIVLCFPGPLQVSQDKSLIKW